MAAQQASTQELHAAALEFEMLTAEEYAWNDDTHYRMGRLLITSSYMNDIGMVGLTAAERQQLEGMEPSGEDQAGATEADELLQAMGLPTSFGNKKAEKQQKKRRQKAGELEAAGPETQPCEEPPMAAHAAVPASTSAPADSWHQAYDATTAQYYYYNSALQVTQWHPPEAGFVPLLAAVLGAAAAKQKQEAGPTLHPSPEGQHAQAQPADGLSSSQRLLGLFSKASISSSAAAGPAASFAAAGQLAPAGAEAQQHQQQLEASGQQRLMSLFASASRAPTTAASSATPPDPANIPGPLRLGHQHHASHQQHMQQHIPQQQQQASDGAGRLSSLLAAGASKRTAANGAAVNGGAVRAPPGFPQPHQYDVQRPIASDSLALAPHAAVTAPMQPQQPAQQPGLQQLQQQWLWQLIEQKRKLAIGNGHDGHHQGPQQSGGGALGGTAETAGAGAPVRLDHLSLPNGGSGAASCAAAPAGAAEENGLSGAQHGPPLPGAAALSPKVVAVGTVVAEAAAEAVASLSAGGAVANGATGMPSSSKTIMLEALEAAAVADVAGEAAAAVLAADGGGDDDSAAQAAATGAAAAALAAVPAGSKVVLDPTSAAHVRKIVNRKVARYWLLRYSLFSRFDEGVQLDTEGWYSVTPEVIAEKQAQWMAAEGRCVAVDPFVGCGGNAIQMARYCGHCIAVDIHARRAAMCAHNAAIYGVAHSVEVLVGDFFQVGPDIVADVVFLSPPWGGPMYKHCDTFDVFEPIQGLGVSLARVVEVAFGISARGCARSGRGGRGGGGWARVCCFLPRNTNLRQLAELVPEGVVWHVERDYVNERLKGISVYAYQRVGSGGS